MADDEGKFRESVWSIHPKWRGWFYGVLSICGVAVSVFTLVDEWGNGWLEIFDEIRNSIVSSVVVVWFVFQVMESAMGAYQYFQDLKEQKLQKMRQEAEDRRQKELEQARKEAEEQARRKAEYQKAYEKAYDEYLMREHGLTKEQIQEAHQHTSSIGPSLPHFPQ